MGSDLQKSFYAGKLSGLMTPKTLFLFFLAAAVIIAAVAYRASGNTSGGCVRCHSDKEGLEKLKASWAYVTDEVVRKESRHSTIQCRDCHLGNGRSNDKKTAHAGMLKMLIVSETATLLSRAEGYPYGLASRGEDRLEALMPKKKENGIWVSLPVRNILWHDRNPVTFDFDRDIAAKTCGKSGCHVEELKQFGTSVMGTNHRQRTMQTWTRPYGPHNCGPSFADRPPSETETGQGFDYRNMRGIVEELNVGFSAEQATDKQKFCNVCHSGCLDCHYTPMIAGPDSGVHSFRKTPSAESCSGYGRSNTICHPGAMHSRRGETYIGGDYSMPRGMEPDVHYKKGIGCIACHATGEGGMGHIERKGSCRECHNEIEDALATDPHKNMDCATCHISELRGYQITAWGPGLVAGKKNPFNKYSLYYGIQSPPILVKDQKGTWMPVKIWPHTLANVKPDVPSSGQMQFRWPKGETRDAYYVIGTSRLEPEKGTVPYPNEKYLLWLEIEQAAHPYGRSRECGSCHDRTEQTAVSSWDYVDNQGAEPFSGGYTIKAGLDGIVLQDMRTTSEIAVLPGYKLTDFAPWLFLRNKWKVPGDFSIKTDRKKYKAYRGEAGSMNTVIKALDLRSTSFDRTTLRKYKVLRAYALHNPEAGLKRLKTEFP